MRSRAAGTTGWRRRARAAGALALLTAGCAAQADRLQAPRPQAQRDADALLGAVAARLGPLSLDPQLAELRPLLASASFTPSRIFDDDVWAFRDERTRRVGFTGQPARGGYRLGLVAEPPPLRAAGDYRGMLELRRHADHEYEWRWLDELALGEGSPDFTSDLVGLLLHALEDPGGDARQRLLAAAPRSAASLGRLARLERFETARLERFETARQPDGATHLGLRFSLDPRGIAGEFPAWSRYLQRHVRPVQMNLQVRDAEGRRWWGLDLKDLVFSVRLRVHDGRLAPLDHPPVPMPEALIAELDLSTRSGILRVGFDDLKLQVRLVRTPHEKSFLAVGREPPGWRIPFVFQPVLKSALNRPFEGDGVSVEAGIRSAEPGQTSFESRLRFVVLESWIVRRMGGFVAGPASEFRREAEAEAHRFQGQVLEALREDIARQLAPPGARLASGDGS